MMIDKLKNKYKGQRIYIIGNGPSLREINVSLLKNEYTFSFNRAYLAYKNWGFSPSFYSVIDRVVLKDNKHEINNMISNKSLYKDTLFFFPFWSDKIIKKDKNVFFLKEKVKRVFDDRVNKTLNLLGNVGATSVQIALYLGFKEIVLVGIDANYVEKPKNIKEIDNRVYGVNWKVYEGTGDDDPNHFLPNYFGKGKRYSIPNAHIHRLGWRLVKDWIRTFNILNPDDKICIVDTSLKGKLRVFKKVRFEKVVKKKVLNCTQRKKNIVVWGTGEAALRFLIKEGKYYRVLFFVDNDKENWGKNFLGKKILEPKYLLKTKDYDFIVVAVQSGMKILKNQLTNMNIYEKCVYYEEL